MNKFWLGLAVGIVITLIGIQLIDNLVNPAASPATISQTEANESSAQRAQSQQGPITKTDSIAEPQPGASSLANDNLQNTFQDSSVDSLSPPQDLSAKQMVQAPSTQSSSSNSASLPQSKPSANKQSVVSIPLTEQHRTIVEKSRAQETPPTTLHGLHDRINAENYDDTWSYYMEENIRTYLGAVAAPAGVDVVGVDCRSTICVVQAFNYSNAGYNIWQQILGGMKEQPWAEGFTGSNMFSSDAENGGSEVVFFFLTRKDESETPQE